MKNYNKQRGRRITLTPLSRVSMRDYIEQKENKKNGYNFLWDGEGEEGDLFGFVHGGGMLVTKTAGLIELGMIVGKVPASARPAHWDKEEHKGRDVLIIELLGLTLPWRGFAADKLNWSSYVNKGQVHNPILRGTRSYQINESNLLESVEGEDTNSPTSAITPIYSGPEIRKMSKQMWGKNWQQMLGKSVGLSKNTAYQYTTKHHEVFPTKYTLKFLMVYNEWKARGSIPPSTPTPTPISRRFAKEMLVEMYAEKWVENGAVLFGVVETTLVAYTSGDELLHHKHTPTLIKAYDEWKVKSQTNPSSIDEANMTDVLISPPSHHHNESGNIIVL